MSGTVQLHVGVFSHSQVTTFPPSQVWIRKFLTLCVIGNEIFNLPLCSNGVMNLHVQTSWNIYTVWDRNERLEMLIGNKTPEGNCTIQTFTVNYIKTYQIINIISSFPYCSNTIFPLIYSTCIWHMDITPVASKSKSFRLFSTLYSSTVRRYLCSIVHITFIWKAVISQCMQWKAKTR